MRIRKLVTSAAVALALVLGFVAFADEAAAQGAGTGTGSGAGAGSTAAPGTSPTGPTHGREIDLPIGGPISGFEEEDPVEPTEDDGPTLYDEDIPVESDSIIYVIDVSGSMGWDVTTYTGLDGNPTSGNRLDRAKVELIRSIQGLPENFTFNIVAYDCDMRRWAPGRQQANMAAKASAINWVNGLRPGGATGTGPAVALGLQERDNLTIALLSDGDPNCPYDYNSIPNHLQCILSANQQGAVVHCFGIRAYGEFEQFLRDVASRTGGVYYPIN